MINDFNNPKPYFATMIEQYSEKSIVTSKGIYDFVNFSSHELETINSVLENARTKYPPNHHAIGLAIETQGIKYKPRYILFEMLIIQFATSQNHLDQLATGLAYVTKGYYFQEAALRYLEPAITKVTDYEALLLSRTYSKWWIYHSIALLCEQSYRFTDALKYAGLSIQNKGFMTTYDYTRIGDIYKKISIDRCVNYYEALLNEISLPKDIYPIIKNKGLEMKKLAAEGYVFKPHTHKRSKHSITIEHEIHEAALQFI